MIRRPRLLALLALAPAAALAQAGALDAARGAHRTSAAGNARVESAADAALAPDAAAPAGDAGIDLAAAPLEGGGAPTADGGQGTVPPPDTYTVRPGDTLWDLSGRFLNNPWYWPKIWSYNPDIGNPHWIYPGNVLKFFPSAEEAPTRVEPVDPEVATGLEQPEEDDFAVAPLEDVSKADMNAPAKLDGDLVSYGGTRKAGYYVAPRTQLIRHDTFVTPKELDESGAIKAAFDEKMMLTMLDRAYASFKGDAPVRVGETYLIYKTERPIYRPGTKVKELIGYQSTVLGAARVVAVDDTAATIIITSAAAPIERGAMLGPWVDKLVTPLKRKPNGTSQGGMIVGAPYEVLTQLAQHQVVFIDKGTSDGVEEGNSFTVVRSGDLRLQSPNTPLNDPSLPKEDVGDLLVIDARENTSAALVTKSIVELFVGDRVEMRAAEGAAPRTAPAAASEPAASKHGGGLFDEDEDEAPAKK
jgi:hypothetical protein